MESSHEYGSHLHRMLPPFVRSTLPLLPARLRSLTSLRSPVPGGAFCDARNPPSCHCEVTASFINDNGSTGMSINAYSEPADSSSSDAPALDRQLPSTALLSVSGMEDEQDHSEFIKATQNSVDNLQYDRLMRHFLRSVREMDARRQLDSQRLLEVVPRKSEGRRIGGREPRLPLNFNGQSHDAVDHRWSPSGIKWRYARQGQSAPIHA
jgi:hypothetical protein